MNANIEEEFVEKIIEMFLLTDEKERKEILTKMLMAHDAAVIQQYVATRLDRFLDLIEENP